MTSNIIAANELQAIILCGGLGSRLREETEFKPKPMVTIGDRPILWHIMRGYRHFGIKDFVLCLGYKGDIIRDYFLNYHLRASDVEIDLSNCTHRVLSQGDDASDWKVVLAETGAETQTGERVRRVAPYIKGERFLATYGDGLSDVDLDLLLEHHKKSGRLATVTAVHPSSRFGELSLDGNVVTSFMEKPQVGQGWVNGGFFVFERRALDLIEPRMNEPLETGLLERLAAQGELAVYRHNGFWQCMDTYREMELLNRMWAEGRAPWRKW